MFEEEESKVSLKFSSFGDRKKETKSLPGRGDDRQQDGADLVLGLKI